MSAVVLSPRDKNVFMEIVKLISPATCEVRWIDVQPSLWRPPLSMNRATANLVLMRLESQGIVVVDRPDFKRSNTWVVRTQPIKGTKCPRCDRMAEWSCMGAQTPPESRDRLRTRLPVPMGHVRCSMGPASTVDLHGPTCDWPGLPVARIDDKVFVVLNPKP